MSSPVHNEKLTLFFYEALPRPRTDFPRPRIVVNCLADGVQVEINIGDPVFNGVMYVKGYSNNEECRRALRQGIDQSVVDFKVKFGTCGLIHENVCTQSKIIFILF